MGDLLSILESLRLTDASVTTADAFPSHLLPNSGTPEAALQRARIHFFVDTFSSKVPSQALAISLADSEEERNEKTKTFIATIRDEIAPLLADAAPFFGGSKKPTLAEVNAGSFVLRYYGLGKKEYGLYPEWMVDELRGIEVWQRWVDEVVKLESVTGIWNEKEVAELTKKKLASLKAQRAK